MPKAGRELPLAPLRHLRQRTQPGDSPGASFWDGINEEDLETSMGSGGHGHHHALEEEAGPSDPLVQGPASPPASTGRSPQVTLVIWSLIAGIGGFLFGYDTGVIAGALLYIRDDFPQLQHNTLLQETIVSMAIAGAAIGAIAGGYLNDRYGRKAAILQADAAFALGALAMAVAPAPWVIIVGRFLVGLGVGLASMAVPLYLAEAAPGNTRGALVSINVFMITTGQFVSYIVNYAFTTVPGTWRWMLGVAAVPALLQWALMLTLPESPRWLFRQGRVEEALAALRMVRSAREAAEEIHRMAAAEEEEDGKEEERQRAGRGGGEVEEVAVWQARKEGGSLGHLPQQRHDDLQPTQDLGEEESPLPIRQEPRQRSQEQEQQRQQLSPVRTWDLVSTVEMRLALTAGVGLQVFQQLVGINTVMYYSPSIIELAGIAAKQTVLLLSMVVAAMNAAGTVAGIVCIDRFGRRKLVIASLSGVLAALLLLAAAFSLAAADSPPVSSEPFGRAPELQCGGGGAGAEPVRTCGECLNRGCGFCASGHEQVLSGSCLLFNATSSHACSASSGSWYTHGCPTRYGLLALAGLATYIAAFAPGMGPVPWAVNAEIYPLPLRGRASGLAATSNWVANLLVAQTFLTLTRLLGTAATFGLFAVLTVMAIAFVIVALPETKGIPMKEIEELWVARAKAGGWLVRLLSNER